MLEVLKQLMEETPDNLLAKYVLHLKKKLCMLQYYVKLNEKLNFIQNAQTDNIYFGTN